MLVLQRQLLHGSGTVDYWEDNVRINANNKRIIATLILIISCLIFVLSYGYLVTYYPLRQVFFQNNQMIPFATIFIMSILLYMISIMIILKRLKKSIIDTMLILILVLNVLYIALFSYNRPTIELPVDGRLTWLLMGFPIILITICSQFINNNKSSK